MKNILVLTLACICSAQPPPGGGGGGTSSGQVSSSGCGTATACATDGSSYYISRALTYSIATGEFSGTIKTNQCPSNGNAYKFKGVQGSMSGGSPTCITQTFPAPAYAGTKPIAAPLRGRVGLAIRGGENIYGPMDAGFKNGQLCDVSTLGQCPAGTDVMMCEADAEKQCGSAGMNFGMLMSDCGGHASPYHYHCHLYCEYNITAAMVGGAHAPLVGVMLDGRGLYGEYESGGKGPTDLDACGGHYGPVPVTNLGNGETYAAASSVYHYHVQHAPPFLVGCFGPTASLTQAKALYPSCSTSGTCTSNTNCVAGNLYKACTSKGYTEYTLDCPVYSQGSDKFNHITPTAECPVCEGNCTRGTTTTTTSTSGTLGLSGSNLAGAIGGGVAAAVVLVVLVFMRGPLRSCLARRALVGTTDEKAVV